MPTVCPDNPPYELKPSPACGKGWAESETHQPRVSLKKMGFAKLLNQSYNWGWVMGVLVAVIGGIIALVCLAKGILVLPQSAPQQAVQELRFVEAALGAIIFALGIVVYQLGSLRRARAEQPGTAGAERAAENASAGGSATFVIGSRVKHKDRGAGEVTSVDGDV